MKLEEAIEVDIMLMAAPVLKNNPKIIRALSLSIEALRGIIKVRKTLEPYVTALLPGETEE